MTEADLASWVLDVARVYGWRAAHFRPARTERGWRTPVQGDGVGWPDLVLIHPKRGLGMALELKAQAGRVTAEQREWLNAFAAAGWVAMVVRPSDRDEVRRLLAS